MEEKLSKDDLIEFGFVMGIGEKYKYNNFDTWCFSIEGRYSLFTLETSPDRSNYFFISKSGFASPTLTKNSLKQLFLIMTGTTLNHTNKTKR